MQDEEASGSSDLPLIENATFETAIAATGFGCFTALFMCITVSGGWATWFSVTVMSYVIPVAECDLNLSVANKGQLNAIPYLGMMTTGIMWGYLSDTLGRRVLIIVISVLDILLTITAGLSQNFTMLITVKFFSGCVITGIYTILIAYTSEILKNKYRSMFLLLQAMFNVVSLLILPVLAFLILPMDYHFTVFNAIEMRSWGIFIIVTSFPSFLTLIGGIWLDESPKFLMTIGKNEKALKALQRVYALNYRKPENTYPIKSLVDEISIRDEEGYQHGGKITANRSKKLAMKEGLQQFKPLFFPPHRSRMIMVLCLNFLIMASTNSLRLWLPEIFKNIFLQETNSPDICYALRAKNITKEPRRPGDKRGRMFEPADPKCEPFLEKEIYFYLMIVSAATIILFCLSGVIVNHVGQKILLIIYTSISGSCAMLLYFVRYGMVALTIILTVCVSLGSICVTLTVTVIVDLVPTHLRTMLLSMAFFCGRCGAMTGNFLLPLFIKYTGCPGPFVAVLCGFLGSAIIAVFLPKRTRRPR